MRMEPEIPMATTVAMPTMTARTAMPEAQAQAVQVWEVQAVQGQGTEAQVPVEARVADLRSRRCPSYMR